MRAFVALAICLFPAAVTPNASPSPVTAGSFACYTAAFSEFATRKISVTDQLGTRVALVSRPTNLCAPAVVNGAAIGDSVAHLTCHPIKLPANAPTRISVRNEFGVLNATLERGTELCIPSSTATGGALRPPRTALASFVCYSMRLIDRFAPRSASVADEFFGKTRDLLLRPSGICLPASLGAPRPLESEFLACYTVKSVARVVSRPIVVRTTLALLQASLGLRNELCQLSTKLLR